MNYICLNPMNTFEFEQDPCYRVKYVALEDVRIYSLMSDELLYFEDNSFYF